MKRPAVAIGTPFYNWGRDYYAVGEDHVKDFKKQPIRSELIIFGVPLYRHI